MEELLKQLLDGQKQIVQSNENLTTEIRDMKLDLARMEQESGRNIGLFLDGWQKRDENYSAVEEQIGEISETLERIDLTMVKIATSQSKQSNILETLSVRSVEQESELRSLKIAR
jgi:hypothetical protein